MPHVLLPPLQSLATPPSRETPLSLSYCSTDFFFGGALLFYECHRSQVKHRIFYYCIFSSSASWRSFLRVQLSLVLREAMFPAGWRLLLVIPWALLGEDRGVDVSDEPVTCKGRCFANGPSRTAVCRPHFQTCSYCSFRTGLLGHLLTTWLFFLCVDSVVHGHSRSRKLACIARLSVRTWCTSLFVGWIVASFLHEGYRDVQSATRNRDTGAISVVYSS